MRKIYIYILLGVFFLWAHDYVKVNAAVKKTKPQKFYCEGYFYDNEVATIIETADTPIGLYGATLGPIHGLTYDVGGTGAITVYADYSGTVEGAVLITSEGHGLETGDIITIRGTTSYNGVFQVTVISVDTFYIIDTWVENDGASDFDKPGGFTVKPGCSGIYIMSGFICTAPSAACTLVFKTYVNTTPQYNTYTERKYAQNDLDTTASVGLLTLSEGDFVWVAVKSDSTQSITNKHGGFSLRTL